MTSDSPFEAPHYNGKTLSPASPKPIHIPDSQNIPVLQNQNDPVFNLVSTHMETPQGISVMHDPPAAPEEIDFAPERTDASDHVVVNGAHTGPVEGLPQSSGMTNDGLDESQPARESAHVPSVGFQSPDESTPHQSHLVHAMGTQSQSVASNNTLDEPIAAATSSVLGLESLNATNPNRSPEVLNKSSREELNIETGNIQALLDNLIASASSNAPSGDLHATTPGVAPAAPAASSPSTAQTPISSLPTPAGLPPRPPPQEEASIHPSHAAGQGFQTYHNPPSSGSAQTPSTPTLTSFQASQNLPTTNVVGPNGMPPPPGATFEHPAKSTASSVQESSLQKQDDSVNQSGSPLIALGESGTKQPAAENDHVYQDFLRDEASYVAEGSWDRFPAGSRLFVGNLFTEKVSKRDIFDVFSPYGRLAQISMKNAYGFVQFIDPGSSSRAMVAEEGTELGGRKIHLEISKPQKNSRNNNNTGDRMRGSHGRRSRSPDYNKGGQTHTGTQRSSIHGAYDRRGRDDYRPIRSPSPRSSRGYDARGMDRYYGNRRSRSRSPYGRNVRYRSRSPRGRDIEDEASLPIPRRNPVQVPDVQIIVVDESDRTFVGYIQQSFRDRGLRCEVLPLPRGVSLQAVVKRQIIEGVQAVVKIYRKSQVTGKIPLQIFDRSGGMNNVRFDEYEELDAGVAADVVIRAKQSASNQSPATPQYGQNYSHTPALNAQSAAQQHVPQSLHHPGASVATTSVQNAIQSLDSQTLQKLLSSLNQGAGGTPQYQGSPQQGQPPQDLAALLGNVTRQAPQAQQGAYPQPPTPTQGYQSFQAPQQQQQQYPQQSQPAVANPFANNPALAQLLNRAQSGVPQGGSSQYQGMHHQQQQQQQQQQQPGSAPQNVQDIMAQLAKYRQ